MAIDWETREAEFHRYIEDEDWTSLMVEVFKMHDQIQDLEEADECVQRFFVDYANKTEVQF